MLFAFLFVYMKTFNMYIVRFILRVVIIWVSDGVFWYSRICHFWMGDTKNANLGLSGNVRPPVIKPVIAPTKKLFHSVP